MGSSARAGGEELAQRLAFVVYGVAREPGLTPGTRPRSACSHTESSRALAVLALALLAAAARRGRRVPTRRMASFDRDAISETHDVPALLVPAKRTSAYVKALRRHLVS